ncbi:MAG: MogA/MoaB family molybdenum cofactor biosynthesis protein [Defluviitaleaceae bacterium]|nr:MogA/MoaB family molybdenum cofactor biosynthesis protein [Defluviitaleaceae bacterium]
MYRCGVITVSDKGAAGEREDISGAVIREVLREAGLEVTRYEIIPDDLETIKSRLTAYADDGLDLILTTGGTGFSPRDVTPEATKAVTEREAPGVCEAIRAHSMCITNRAMLSRAVCGIRGYSVILNLPGSPKAVRESLEYVLDALVHGLDILSASASDCAR